MKSSLAVQESSAALAACWPLISRYSPAGRSSVADCRSARAAQCIDATFLQYTVAKTLQRSASVHLLFSFEYVIQMSIVLAAYVKYTLGVIDNCFEGRWESKVCAMPGCELRGRNGKAEEGAVAIAHWLLSGPPRREEAHWTLGRCVRCAGLWGERWCRHRAWCAETNCKRAWTEVEGEWDV